MDTGARVTGLLTFVAGLVLLVIVFFTALGIFNQSRTAPSNLQLLPGELVILVSKVLMLFIMGYIGSAIANRGIQLYESARTREETKDTPITK